MRYTVRKSLVYVVGKIWMPMGPLFAQTFTVRADDLLDDDGKITRESVEQWLCCHAGDFSSIEDFSASIEHGEETIDIPWASEEGELAYCDATCGEC